MSAIDFFSIGFGAMVGVGWAVSLNKWMQLAGGPIPAAIGFLILMLLLIPVALCYSELVPMLPVAGGGMAFSYKAFGEKTGLIAGWAAFGGFLSVIPWEAIQLTDVLCYLMPNLKSGTPLYTLWGTDVYPISIVLGTIFSLLIFLLNMRGMSAAVVFQKALCVILVVTCVIGAVASVIGGSPKNLLPVFDSTNPLIYGDAPGLISGVPHNLLGGILSFLPFSIFFLVGFETIPQGVEEAGGDTKGVGRAVVLSIVSTCVFYAGVSFFFGFGYPWQEFAQPVTNGGIMENPSAATMFLYEFAGSSAGKILYWIIVISALAGLFTSWNGFFRPTANLMMGMARGRLIPGVFAKQNDNGIPVPAMVFCLVFSLIGPLFGAGVIGGLTIFTGAAYVVSWILSSFSQARLRTTLPDHDRPYMAPGGKIMGFLGGGLMTILFVLMFIPGNPCYIGAFASWLFIGWMGLGVLFYLLAGGERRKMPKETREALLFEHAED